MWAAKLKQWCFSNKNQVIRSSFHVHVCVCVVWVYIWSSDHTNEHSQHGNATVSAPPALNNNAIFCSHCISVFLFAAYLIKLKWMRGIRNDFYMFTLWNAMIMSVVWWFSRLLVYKVIDGMLQNRSHYQTFAAES